MSRLSFRPRPVDIHKKLPIFKSLKDFEDDSSSSSSSTLRFQDVPPHTQTLLPTKKSAGEIPTPQYDIVDTYETDYLRTFIQPTSYIRASASRAQIADFVEYDLDDLDEDWYHNSDFKHNLSAQEFEILLFKLEVMDHKARERAGVITPTFTTPVPVLLHLDAAFQMMQLGSLSYRVFESIYSYWKAKRERWQKPILRPLQPPPPVTDTNPYNVFRPREKSHRFHTRRMQRRENNVLSFERLRQVRRNLEQTKTAIEALINREEKKREVVENEVSILRLQMNHTQELQFLEDGSRLSFPLRSSVFSSSESDDDEFTDSDGMEALPVQPTFENNLPFTRPLVPEKLAGTGIKLPFDPPKQNGTLAPLYRFHGRFGRGGRLVFDRWNPLLRTPLGHENASFVTPI